MTAVPGHEREPDVYIRPRYPVDEPPTYRARCECGWTGPERYRGITDADWEGHMKATKPGAVSGLRDQLAEKVWTARTLRRNPDELIEWLLPVVEAAIRRERAQALRDAADDLYGPPGSVAEYPERPAWLAARLRARADAEETAP